MPSTACIHQFFMHYPEQVQVRRSVIRQISGHRRVMAVNTPRKQVTMFIQTTESRGIVYDEKSQLLAAVLHPTCLA